MKSIFTFLFSLLFSICCYSQEIEENNSYKDKISLQNNEIYSSGVVKFDFQVSQIFTYKIIKEESVFKTSILEKKEGIELKKIDFSFLVPGEYSLHFYIDDIEINKFLFDKL